MRTNSADYGHGGAYVRKREVRALARVCSPMAFIAALLAVFLVPSVALADSSVIWGPSVLPSQDIGIVVNAPDKYRAAAVTLGHTDAEVSSWSDDVLAKLSNASTGGSFYTFAQKFGEVDDAVGNDNPLSAVVSAVGNSFWAIAETLYGDEIWLAGYSAAEFESAANDLASIINGGNVGGGGSSSGIPNPVTFTMSDWVGREDYKRWVKDYEYSPLNVTVNVDTTMISNDFGQYVDTHPYSYYCLWQNGSAVAYNGGMTLDVYICSQQGEIRNDGLYLVGNVWHRQYSTTNLTVNGVNNISLTDGARKSQYTSNVLYREMDFSKIMFCTDGQSSMTPVVPPTNWPDEPSAPTPPELPEPGTNPTVTPTPWTPVLSPTFDFDLNITTDPNSSDLIDWVQKIYYELKAFHRDAHDWANDFGGGFTKVVQAVNSASSQLYSQLLVIDKSIHDEGHKIRNYMYQMFHWLKDQLDFQNNSFDDNNIVYWLKRIWSKLGSGDINLRPTDPTSEPENWWDWLVKAIQNFLIGLAATSTELISEIADLASQVMHEFPFSIPWDIAAVLAALSTSPITPVFTITIPAVDGWWASFDFVIDMSPFDGAAETIRLMEKLLFTGLLIWKSKDLLDFMDVTKWFN